MVVPAVKKSISDNKTDRIGDAGSEVCGQSERMWEEKESTRVIVVI